MTVLHLTSCPPALRGDITKWLMEIATGVYIGRVSARVRDKLWDRVVETCKGGRAVLVYGANNEQRMDFRIHGETWEPVDFDGLKLIMRPNPSKLVTTQAIKGTNNKLGFSNASKYRMASNIKKSKKHKHAANNSTYVVIDVETTGLKPEQAKMIEIGAIKIKDGMIDDAFQSLIKIDGNVPQKITDLTGITDDMLDKHGKDLKVVLNEFIIFASDFTLVAHNASFDISFINDGLNICGYPLLDNKIIDTLSLARNKLRGLNSYKLLSVAKNMGVDNADLNHANKGVLQMHRSLGDCYQTHLIYEKLMDFEKSNK